MAREEFIKNGGVIKRGRPAFKSTQVEVKDMKKINFEELGFKQDKNGKWRNSKGHLVKKELLEQM